MLDELKELEGYKKIKELTKGHFEEIKEMEDEFDRAVNYCKGGKEEGEKDESLTTDFNKLFEEITEAKDALIDEYKEIVRKLSREITVEKKDNFKENFFKEAKIMYKKNSSQWKQGMIMRHKKIIDRKEIDKILNEFEKEYIHKEVNKDGII